MQKPEPNFDRGLPAAPEAERMLLGSVLAGRVSLDALLATLTGEDFTLEPHRRILARMSDLFERGVAVNRATVAQELQKQRQLESVGGVSFLVDLDGDILPFNVDSYIGLVRSKSVLRKAIYACREISEKCYAATDDAPEVLQEAETLLAKIGDSAVTKTRLLTPAEVKESVPGGASAFFNPKRYRPHIPSPWEPLNEIITGFRPKQLVILAARPGIGKSAAAGQIAHAAAMQGHGVALFSLEMAASEILTRITCTKALVDSHKFQAGYLSRAEAAAFQQASYEIDQLPLRIDDSSGCSVPALQSAVRKMRAKENVGLVIVDYLQLMEAPGRYDNRNQEITAISRGLKKTAREMNLPVIALSQLSRDSAKQSREPQLTDLRESGSIEQDADTVIFLHRPDADADEQELIPTCFIVRKQRGGPIGKKTLDFEKRYTRFL